MSAIWESANWTRQFGIRQTGNRQFGMLPLEITSDLSQVTDKLYHIMLYRIHLA